MTKRGGKRQAHVGKMGATLTDSRLGTCDCTEARVWYAREARTGRKREGFIKQLETVKMKAAKKCFVHTYISSIFRREMLENVNVGC